MKTRTIVAGMMSVLLSGSLGYASTQVEKRMQAIWREINTTRQFNEMDKLFEDLAAIARDKKLDRETRLKAGVMIAHGLASPRGRKYYLNPSRGKLAAEVGRVVLEDVGPHPERILDYKLLRGFLGCYRDLALIGFKDTGEIGVSVCDGVLESGCDVARKAVAQSSKAQTLAAMKRWKEAAEAYDAYGKYLEQIAGDPKYRGLRHLVHPEDVDVDFIVATYAGAGRAGDANALAAKAMKACDAPYIIERASKIMCESSVSTAALEAPLAEIAARLDVSAISFDRMLDMYSKGLMSKGNVTEALAFAKLRYNTCPLSEVNQAIEAVGACLRMADLDMERMTQFVSFQKFGPEGPDGKIETTDDLENPLKAVKIALPDKLEERLRARLEAPLPTDAGARVYDELTGRGSCCLVLGDYDQALRYYKSAYNVAPMSEMREASALIPRVLKAVDGNLIRANAYLQYQKYGPSGEDGKAGTEDDLTDPTPEIEAELSPEVRQALRAACDRSATSIGAMLNRAHCLLALEDYKRAMGQFRMIFVKSGADERSLLQSINGFATLIKAWDGHLCRANQYLLYQKHGSAGPEGKPGSLENPLKDVLKEIQAAK